MASVLPLISLLGSSKVSTPVALLLIPVHGPVAALWFVVPAYCSAIDAVAGAVHADSASCSSDTPPPVAAGAAADVLMYQLIGMPLSASVQRGPWPLPKSRR